MLIICKKGISAHSWATLPMHISIHLKLNNFNSKCMVLPLSSYNTTLLCCGLNFWRNWNCQIPELFSLFSSTLIVYLPFNPKDTKRTTYLRASSCNYYKANEIDALKLMNHNHHRAILAQRTKLLAFITALLISL